MIIPSSDPALSRKEHTPGKNGNASALGRSILSAGVVEHRDETLPLAIPPANHRAIYTLGMEVFFNARHFVVTDGKAGPVHAHSFRVNVKIRQVVQSGDEYMLGFGEVRKLVQGETQIFNDTLLNNISPFADTPYLQPTTENLAAVLYQRIRGNLPDGLQLDSVTIWESPTNYVIYTEEAE